MNNINVLIACEESQRVCTAFRDLGFNAFSCDIQECSGGHPEWHIQGDVLPLLTREDNGNNGWHDIYFVTLDGKEHFVEKWDLIIAHPPCTYLTVTGNRWFNIEQYGDRALQRIKDREEASEFFMEFTHADCSFIAIENPIGYMSTKYKKPDQIIHPYYFASADGDEDCQRKATCFWLTGLPPLEYEIRYEPKIIRYKNGKGTDNPWHVDTMSLPKQERSRLRSQTFPGIAKAMADQWGKYVWYQKYGGLK